MTSAAKAKRRAARERFLRFAACGFEVGRNIGQRKITTYAAASAFYLFLSLFPMVTLICMLIPFTPLTKETLLGFLAVLPESFYSILADIVDDVYTGSMATLSIAAVTTVWSAALSVLSLMRGLDVAYGLQRRTNGILMRLLACLFMVVMLAALIVALCGIVYGKKILDSLQATLHQSWAVTAMFHILGLARYVVTLLFLFSVFLCFYKWMPYGKRRLSDQWRGALFATVTWLVFSWVFNFYVSLSGRYGLYGALGTVLVAMLWMYYCMFFLLAGGVVNHVFQKQMASETTEALPEQSQEIPVPVNASEELSPETETLPEPPNSEEPPSDGSLTTE